MQNSAHCSKVADPKFQTFSPRYLPNHPRYLSNFDAKETEMKRVEIGQRQDRGKDKGAIMKDPLNRLRTFHHHANQFFHRSFEFFTISKDKGCHNAAISRQKIHETLELVFLPEQIPQSTVTAPLP